MLRDADRAATPRAALRWRLPDRVLADLTRPADSLLPGETPAQDARCSAVGNTLMSAPVSAMNTSATTCDQPGMSTSRSRAARRAIASSMRASRWAIRLVGVDPIQIQPHHERVVVVEPSLQRLGQCGDLLA